MQSLKDTFYLALRDRIAAANPGRSVVVRGALRTGVIVVENELPGAAVEGFAVPEAFGLRWTLLKVDAAGPSRLTTATCEIRYATDGSVGAGSMDRGRALAAMDAELAAALDTAPRSVVKVPNDGTSIFWGEPLFGTAAMQGERMTRSATVEVFAYGD